MKECSLTCPHFIGEQNEEREKQICLKLHSWEGSELKSEVGLVPEPPLTICTLAFFSGGGPERPPPAYKGGFLSPARYRPISHAFCGSLRAVVSDTPLSHTPIQNKARDA